MVPPQVDRLTSALNAHSGLEPRPANIYLALSSTALEIVTSFCLGCPFNALDYAEFKHPALLTLLSSAGVYFFLQHFPFLIPLAFHIPQWLQTPEMQAVQMLFKDIEDRVDIFLACPSSLKDAEHETIFHHLINSKSDRGIPTKRSILDEASAMIATGIDAISNTCSVGIFHVLNNPAIRIRLIKELEEAWPEKSTRVGVETLEKLPYLTAVIKESLRFSHGFVSPLPRVVQEDVVIGKAFVPAGTVVAMGHSFIHNNHDIFPDPQSFNPDRWLGEDKSKALDRCLVAFSKGPRMCLGVDLAWCELYLLFGNLLRKLDMQLYNTTEGDFDYKAYLTPVYVEISSEADQPTGTFSTLSPDQLPEASSALPPDQPATAASSILSPDQPTETSSTLSPDQSTETLVILSPDQPTDSVSEALPSNEQRLQKLTSLLKLFETLGCFHKYDEKFVLIDTPTPLKWDLFINAAACVGELELDKQAKNEAAQITPAAYIRLVRELKGKHLFPEVWSIYVEDFEGLMDYMVIFLSPTLQVVELVTTASAAAETGVMPLSAAPVPPVFEAFVSDLAEWSPKLRSLKIRRPSMPVSLFKNISLLSNLRILELSSIIGVESYEDFFPLAPTTLKTLAFESKSSCTSYTQHDNPIIPPTPSLSSLEKLTISGPLALVARFFSISWASRKSAKIFGLKRIKGSKKLIEERDIVDKGHSETINNLVTYISSRWKHSLRRLTIKSPIVSDESIDFGCLVDFFVLETFWVSGYATSDIPRALASSQSGVTFPRLKVLRLPRSATIAFEVLPQIAIASPCLEELTVALDVKEAPPDFRRALSHPLKTLVIKGFKGSDTFRCDFPSFMASTTSSECSFETDLSVETTSSLSLEQPAAPAPPAPPTEKKGVQKLTSLLTLFEKLECFKKHGERFVFFDRPTASEWKLCTSIAACIDRLELDQGARKEVAQIAPAVYIRVLQELKGKALFPELRSARIEDFDQLVDYLAIFLSPALETVELVAAIPTPTKSDPMGFEDNPPLTTAPPALGAFIDDLAEWSPGLRSLKVTRLSMAKSLFKNVSLLGNLRVLELSTIVGIENLKDFRPLAPLLLESLVLHFSCTSYSPLESQSGVPSSRAFFPCSLGSQSLAVLNIEITSINPKVKRKKGENTTKRATLASQLARSKSINGLATEISFRWKETLRQLKLALACSYERSVNIEHFPEFRALEKLEIIGYSIADLSFAPAASDQYDIAYPRLRVLRLPRSATIAFEVLRQIVLAAPCLEELTVAFDVKEVPPAIRQALSHPLKLLVIEDQVSRHCDWGSPTKCSSVSVDDVPHYIRISRFLNATFPALKKLEARGRDSKAWAMVWQFISLCQGAIADDKSREPAQEQVHDEFEVV
ncbi:hypothetical protein NP233_g3619 [Leucocoprinus birnbaumii]|uniref:Cytochrome P450 n=1 Tax=Leucocoprinus birnbaumii TaxID=56174 RepID=A0AAD5YY74_9AGAR|nr:hypothetical protein NP233_g3619 [Leucocoprinus birnbaumii]